MSALWRIEMLGGLRVISSEREVTRFRTQKTALLLAYLAHRLERVPREVLLALLWPEAEEEPARSSLRQSLFALRHQLEPPGVPAGSVLVSDRARVHLDPGAVHTDVSEFEAALESAKRAPDDGERLSHLDRAVSLYRGDFLPGYYEEWVLREQQRLADRFFEALDLWSELSVRHGDPERSIPHAQRAVRLDPLREEAHRALIRLYAATGQTDLARRQFEEVGKIFSERLGTVPSEQTRAALAAPEAGRRSEASAPAESDGPLGEGAPALFGIVTLVGTRLPADNSGPLRESLLHSISSRGGREVRVNGDALLAAFGRATDARACAFQWRQLASGIPLVLVTGEVEPQKGGYPGRLLRRAAALLGVAHPGQVLCGETTTTLLRNAGGEVAITDLGRFRLSDVDAPERLFQLTPPGSEERNFPPPTAAPAFEDHLPPSFTRFFGREDEIARLVGMLTIDGHRLVTLTGPGGSGKTRLSLEVARKVQAPFAGAVWFVPLADLSDPERIPDAVLSALRLPRSPTADPVEQASVFLARQPSLLVLDNMEHLVEGGAEVVQRLREKVANLTILGTSRRVLSLPGEREVPVPPLPAPEEGQSLTEAILEPSVLLFIDRAQAALADFQVTPGNVRAVSELCRRLEGIPLAIELSASQARTLTPARMVRELSHRFDLLASRQRGVPERHRTLRAALDWSYDLLPEEMRRFFRGLSVFRGGWTVAAAVAVCEEAHAALCLDHLRDASLVLVEVTDEGPRYRMLETVREYGWERMTDEERDSRRSRHIEYFAAMAKEAETQIEGPNQTQWLTRFGVEHDNIRAALAWGTAYDGRAALDLAGPIADFWWLRGHLSEGRAWLAKALSAPGASDPTHARAFALFEAGYLALRDGDFRDAENCLHESLSISRHVEDPLIKAHVLNVLGSVAGDRGDYENAKRYYGESLAVRRDLGDRLGTAKMMNNLGNVFFGLGDLDEADALYTEALKTFREIGDEWGAAHELGGLATVAMARGEADTARNCLEASIASLRQIGDRQTEATMLENLSHAFRLGADTVAARRCMEECLELRRSIGDEPGIVTCLCGLARLDEQDGEPEQARDDFEKALELQRSLGSPPAQSTVHLEYGLLLTRLGDLATARGHLLESLKIRLGLESPKVIAEVLDAFGDLARQSGDPEAAARLYGASVAARESRGVILSVQEQAEHNERVNAVRHSLEPAAFTASWEAGRAMSLAEIVAFAREVARRIPPIGPR